MKLWETFRYELVYQSRSVTTWFYFLLLLVLSFLMAAVVFIDEPLAGGYFSNAPYIVTKASLISFFMLGLLVLAQFAGNAAARDLETRMHPLLYSAPIGRHVYLGGRFLAAFILGAVVILAIPIGVLAAGIFPVEHPELIGPANPWAYLSTYFLILLPNTFFVVAFMFAVAVLKRNGMLSYLIAVVAAVVAIVSWQIFGAQQGNWKLASLTDPLGITILQELKKIWTINEKNTLLPGTESSVVLNRLLWFVLSYGMLLIAYRRFNTATLSKEDKKAVKKRNDAERSTNDYHDALAEVVIPDVPKSFDWSTRMLQLFAIARESFRLIAFGWGWIALACMFLFVVLTGSMWFSDYYDIPELPATGNLLGTLENIKDHGIWLIIPLLIIYYAGELVWRERDVRLNDIMGAAPVPVWVSFAGKFMGVVFGLMVMQFFLMVAGIVLQMSLGYYDFQIAAYFKILFGFRLADYVLLAVLVFALHVMLNQKYLAHLMAVLFYLFTIFGPEFGIESGLLLYASDPGWSYSDLRGLDPFIGPWLFLKSYWAAWAMLLAIMTTVLWPRGTEKSFLQRFKQGTGKNPVRVKALVGLALLLIFNLGAIIHYSTHFLHPKTTSFQPPESKAAYEKLYSKFKNTPQPSLTKTHLQLEIYPDEGSAEFKGSYSMVNREAAQIDTLLISTAPGVEHLSLTWSQAMKSQQADDELNFRIYVLENPLMPGDSIRLDLHVRYHPKGFSYNGMNTVVVANGTYFGDAWLPSIGYQSGREIFNSDDREAQGLLPKTFLEPEVESYSQQRINIDIIIGTAGGQVATAPGRLLRSWTENDRSYFHYATESPVNKAGFFSSNYQQYKSAWKGDSGHVVDINILHHPEHTYNLERMTKGTHASLDYLSRELGPYPHSEIRFSEVPGYNKGLFAYPTNILYREGFALLKPDEDPRGMDIVFATVAHEVSHQWWGSQVSPAPVKGAALITESLAWFSAFEIVEQAQGEDALLKLLDLARDDYFSPQERDSDPLLQAVQTSLIYRKGPLALYALRAYIGKERMRLGLKRFFGKYGAVDAGRPVPSDLYAELKAVTPDSLQYLLHDLFASNTFWTLKTENVTASETASGKWKVTLDLLARKFTVDQRGNETDTAMNDWIELGVYAAHDGTKSQKPFYLKQHRVRSGKQTIEIELDEKPQAAGIDPNGLLIDLYPWDNVMEVEMK